MLAIFLWLKGKPTPSERKSQQQNLILNQGKIVEQGSHNELLERGGLYADLWARQSGGFLAYDETG